MFYSYSYAGAGSGYGESLTTSPNLFGDFVKLVEQFTYMIRQEPIEKKTISETQYQQIEIPPYRFGSYLVTKPIKVGIEHIDDEYVAAFDEAGIAFSAATATEALQLLKAQIIYTYEFYKSNERLGPEPLRQLAILENYIGEKGRQQA
jgi:hypothetical protein